MSDYQYQPYIKLKEKVEELKDRITVLDPNGEEAAIIKENFDQIRQVIVERFEHPGFILKAWAFPE